MCEANAYLLKNEKEELILGSVDIVRPERDGFYLEDIYGEKKWIRGRIALMNLVQHRILFVED